MKPHFDPIERLLQAPTSPGLSESAKARIAQSLFHDNPPAVFWQQAWFPRFALFVLLFSLVGAPLLGHGVTQYQRLSQLSTELKELAAIDQDMREAESEILWSLSENTQTL